MPGIFERYATNLFLFGTTTGDRLNVSSKEVSKYLRPLSFRKTNNLLYEGYSWKKAYYLNPLDTEDSITSSDPDDPNSSVSYENPYWPVSSGKALE